VTIEPVSPRSPGADLLTWAETASAVHRIAEGLSSTTFVPAAMRGKPNDVVAAIMLGREAGMDPMTSLRVIHVIDGQPAWSATAQRGMAIAAGVKFELLEASDAKVRMRARGPNDAKWTEVEWNMARAARMGLADKANWKRMPQAMMIARCTSELCRLVAANLALGLPYSVEELADGTADAAPATVRRHRPAPSPVMAVPERAELTAVPAGEPDPDDEDWPEPVAVPDAG